MDGWSVSEVIEQAVRTEQLGYDFYSSISEKFKDEERLNALFKTLAEKELAHKDRFQKLYEQVDLSEVEGWDELSEYMRAIVESEFFLGSDKAIVRMGNLQSISDAVDYAIAFEKETLLYFLGLRKTVQEKELVDEIISEEQSHIIWLNRYKEQSL